jgi:hypothetical protein
MNIKSIFPIKSMEELRNVAANYMANHPEEFIPFLITEDDSSSVQGKEKTNVKPPFETTKNSAIGILGF